MSLIMVGGGEGHALLANEVKEVKGGKVRSLTPALQVFGVRIKGMNFSGPRFSHS